MYQGELFGLEIHNAEIAQTERQIFFILWNQAKKMKSYFAIFPIRYIMRVCFPIFRLFSNGGGRCFWSVRRRIR